MADITGSDGNDTLHGTEDDDTIDGFEGFDTLYGHEGDDTLNGGDSDDALYGGRGADTLDGGDGGDIAYYDDSDAGVTINLSAMPDADGYVRGAGGHAEGDRLKNIESLTGSRFSDRLTGDSNHNWLSGDYGDDTLYGGPGDDFLYGDANGNFFSLDGGIAPFLVGVHTPDGHTAVDFFSEDFIGIFGEPLLGDDILHGDEGADHLVGGYGKDTLYGGFGDDSLHGGPGADILDGGDGFDLAAYHWPLDVAVEEGVAIDLSSPPDDNGYISGVGGHAEGDRLKNIEGLLGTSHRDHLTGDGNDNRLVGFDGNDMLNGGGGNDYLRGGLGDDTLNGGSGNDILFGDNDLYGFNKPLGDDDGDDVLNGGPGDDRLSGSVGADTLNGGPGDDELHGGRGADLFVFDSGSGHDSSIFENDFEPGVDKIQFTETGITFADLLIEDNGGDARVSWNGGTQSITLLGVVHTGLTESSFLFADDASTVSGTAGNDMLTGTEGADTIQGLAGDDTLDGGPGADMLDGGPGSDTASYQNSPVAVLVRLHAAHAVRFGDAEGDTLTGIEHLTGSPYNDTLAGDGEDNILKGEDGDDVLYGGPAGGDDMMYGGNGDDRIFGGRGDDTLTGGEGNDVLKGGPGEDIFVIDGDDMDVLWGGPDKDTFRFFPSDLGGGSIRDFSDGEDVIDLTAFTGISSMDDLDIVSHGDNVRIEVSGTDYLTTIILSDFDMSNLDNSDFMF